MTDFYASFAGKRATALVVTIPYKGLWIADVSMADEVRNSPPTTGLLVVADLSLLGTVFRAGDFGGNARLRIIGGRGGWSGEIRDRFYQLPRGVSLRQVLSDAARDAGETVEVLVDRKIGSFYARAAGPAERALGQLAGDAWWVRADGVTVVGERASTIITSPFDALEGTDPAAGRWELVTDFPGQWVPGRLFSGPTVAQQRISAVVHTLGGTNLRTSVWAC